jgi:hypothetical protein
MGQALRSAAIPNFKAPLPVIIGQMMTARHIHPRKQGAARLRRGRSERFAKRLMGFDRQNQQAAPSLRCYAKQRFPERHGAFSTGMYRFHVTTNIGGF